MNFVFTWHQKSKRLSKSKLYWSNLLNSKYSYYYVLLQQRTPVKPDKTLKHAFIYGLLVNSLHIHVHLSQCFHTYTGMYIHVCIVYVHSIHIKMPTGISVVYKHGYNQSRGLKKKEPLSHKR